MFLLDFPRIHFPEFIRSHAARAPEAFDEIACVGYADHNADLGHGQIAAIDQQIFGISEPIAHDELARSAAKLGLEPVTEVAVTDMKLIGDEIG